MTKDTPTARMLALEAEIARVRTRYRLQVALLLAAMVAGVLWFGGAL